MMCSMDMLRVGQSARVVSIDVTDKKVKRHLLDMGLTRGAVVKISRIAPMGDPISMYVRGYEISIGKKELKNISVEVIGK